MFALGTFSKRFVQPARSSKFTVARNKGFGGVRAYSTGFPPYLLNIPPTNVSTLSNQLRVATEESHGETATVGVWIDSGSRYETEETNGVAHFLEHMAFKGTKNRTKEKLEIEIENMGGTLNAYTSREQTVYYIKAFKNDVPKAVEILSDILQNSNLEKRFVEAERSTILREMEEVGKDHGEVIFDHLHSAAYQGTSLGRTILGPVDNVKKITREDLLAYIKTNYHAPRMVLAGAGALKHEELVALGQKYFSGLPTSGVTDPAVELAKQKPKFTGSGITIRDDTMDEVHFAIAVESVGWTHPDYYTFMVMQHLIGSWDRTIGGGKNLSSALCEKVAVEGLAKSVNAFNTYYSDTGLFGVYATGEEGKIEDLVFEVLREWNRLGKTTLQSEVDRAKNRLKASLLMSLDGTTAVCEDIGRQLLVNGRRLTPAEVFLRIDSITAKDVMRVASEHLEDSDPAVVAIGPLSHFPDYNQIREWTYWRRW